MQKIKIVKAFLHLAIVLGIIKLFAVNGYSLDAYTKIQNIHGKLFIFGFFGSLITFEKTFNTKFVFLPYLFIIGTFLEILNTLTLLKNIYSYTKSLPSIFYCVGGIIFSIFSLQNLITFKLPSHFFNFLGGLLIFNSSIISKNLRTLLEFENVEYFLLFTIFIILGERIEFTRIFGKNIFGKVQIIFATLTFLSYNIAIFTEHTYKIEKILLVLFLLNSFINDIRIQMLPLPNITKLQRYFRTTLNIAYLFGIIGAILMVYRRFEPGFHSLSLGFIFGMVFSHSIVIFPSIFGKLPNEKKLSYIPFLIFTIANIFRVTSAAVIYPGLFSQKVTSFFSIINIASGFLHFLSIILLFIMIKAIIKK